MSQGYLTAAIIGAPGNTRTTEKTLMAIIQNHLHQTTS